MMNSHMPYYAPFTQGNNEGMVWLNLDPDYRTAATGGVNDWKNFMQPSNVFSQSNSAKRPADNGTELTFDGGDYFTSDDRELDTSVAGWTVYTRYKEDDWSDNSVLAADDDSNNYFIKNLGDRFSVKTYNGSSNETWNIIFDNPSDLIDDTYYNLAVTCTSDGLLTAYIDGVRQADTDQLSEDTYNMLFNEIGGKNGAVWNLTGSIQEILVWEECLSALQVADVSTYLDNKF